MTSACPRCGGVLMPMMAGRAGCTTCLMVFPPAVLPELPALPALEPVRVQAKVLGFRVWRLQGYRLTSANERMGGWEIGVNEAVCKAVQGSRLVPAPREHVAPAHDCECGLYALHQIDSSSIMHPAEAPAVWGAVLAWGRIEVHPLGFRAQYAEPVMLAYYGHQAYEHVKRLEAIASEMALPLVAIDALEGEAARFGKPVAPELRPAWLPLSPSYFGFSASVGAPMLRPVATAAVLPSPPPPARRPP